MYEDYRGESVCDYIISLFPEEIQEDPCSDGEHTHIESKLDKAIRLIETGKKDIGLNIGRGMKLVCCDNPLEKVYRDRVSIEFSPRELTSLIIHFTQQAMKVESYSEQTVMRERRETFDRAHTMWEYFRRARK